MIFYYFRKFMWWLGYRRVLRECSDYGLTYHWHWIYAPHIDERDYNERDFPWDKI